MSVCDYCHAEFFSGGVSAVGIGTFCGHKCKVLTIHKQAGLGTQLHYFRCKFCQAVLVTSIRVRTPERCRCSGSWLHFSHSVEVTTEYERALFAQGRVWNPHVNLPQPWTCERCGVEKSGFEEQKRLNVCRACYDAEEQPPLLTSEQIQQRQDQRKRLRRSMEQREEEHNQQ